MLELDEPALSIQTTPCIRPPLRLQWEEVQQAWVLLYPEGMVKLNGSAGEIIRLCDGERSIEQITAELESRFGRSGLSHDVRSFIEMAIRQRWLDVKASACPLAAK